MTSTTTTASPGVRVVLHVTPSIYVNTLLSAQRRGLKFGEFLDDALTRACASDEQDPVRELPLGPHAMDLFLHLADTQPDAFRGMWKVLYAKVLNDQSLWTMPGQSVGDHEAGEATEGWHINETALTKAWPRLVASTFVR
jgi:hypothetical protein